MDRIAALGNAVVPQIAEMIGKAIIFSDQNQTRSKQEED